MRRNAQSLRAPKKKPADAAPKKAPRAAGADAAPAAPRPIKMDKANTKSCF